VAHSAGLPYYLASDLSQLEVVLTSERVGVSLVDCDQLDLETLERIVARLQEVPVALISSNGSKGPLGSLLDRPGVGRALGRYCALQVMEPPFDERELVVTSRKLLSNDIFGIAKYVGSYGVALEADQVTSVADKGRAVSRLDSYLRQLQCTSALVDPMLTVAEELILNAIVHAPTDASGQAKYESRGPSPDLVLEPSEYVDVVYGCDGQRLMLSVADRFGRLKRKTLGDHLRRAFQGAPLEIASKASGAGLGLIFSLRAMHQIIVNVHEGVRTEVIASWDLGANSGSEPKQMAKSLQLFWVPK